MIALLTLFTLASQEANAAETTEAPCARIELNSPMAFSMREETRLKATRVASSMNGSRNESTEFNPVTTMVTLQAWTDSIEATGEPGARPARVRRKFVQGNQRVLLQIEERGQEKEGRTAASHPAEGRTLLFEAAREGADLTARDVEAAPGAERRPWERAMLLAPSGAALLPEDGKETLEIGATWEVDPADMARFLDPCGLTHETFPAMPGLEDPDLYARYGQLSMTRAAGAEDGKVVARWLGITADSDGRRFGRIELAVTLSGSADTTDWMIAQSKPYEMAAIGYGAQDARLDVELKGVGHVLWDMERGHWAEVHLAVDVEARFRQDYAFEMRGMELNGDLDLSFEGVAEFELLAAPVGAGQ